MSSTFKNVIHYNGGRLERRFFSSLNYKINLKITTTAEQIKFKTQTDVP